jgi:hypothetical protein
MFAVGKMFVEFLDAQGHDDSERCLYKPTLIKLCDRLLTLSGRLKVTP